MVSAVEPGNPKPVFLVKDFNTMGRATQGVRLIQLDEGDHVVAVAKLAEKEDDNGK